MVCPCSADRRGMRCRRAGNEHPRRHRRVMRPLQRHTAGRTPAACGWDVARVAARRAHREVWAGPPIRGRTRGRQPGPWRRVARLDLPAGIHMPCQPPNELGIVLAQNRPNLILKRKPANSRQRPPVQRRQRLRRPLLNLSMRSIALRFKTSGQLRGIRSTGATGSGVISLAKGAVDCC